MLELLFILAFLIIGMGGTILWIWTIIDCATKEPSVGNEKIIWILVIVFATLVGSLIYLLVRRPQRIRLYGQ